MSPPASPHAFVDGALDRADQLRGDGPALAALWPRAHLLVLDGEGRAPLAADGTLAPLPATDIAQAPDGHTFLGLRDGAAWFLAEPAVPLPPASGWIDLRDAASQWPAWQATLFAQSRALRHWHQRHRYCAACGGPLHYLRAGWLGRCEACGSEHYPRTDQAIIVAVTDGRRLLLGRQATWPPRRWSLVAGFVEPGETLEQTVAREVMEETGVRVRTQTARYVGSQPWPFPGSLMLGFIAEADPGEPVAREELEDARWFDADDVRAGLARDWRDAGAGGEGIVLPSPVSIARHVVQAWLQEQDGGHVADGTAG